MTFAANALLKARAVAAATGLPAVADDSGLCVDVLNGMPGIFRRAGRAGTATTAPTSSCCSAQLADVPRRAPAARTSSAPPRVALPGRP